MKKMKLLLDDLQVESFAVDPEVDGMGTVAGLGGSGIPSQCYTHCQTNCEPQTCSCPNAPTQCDVDSCDLCPVSAPGAC
jgi:hypothetical protein